MKRLKVIKTQWDLLSQHPQQQVNDDIIPNGYVYRIDEKGKVIFLHNSIWEKAFGKIPDGQEVYHINGNKLDCRKENLALRKKDNPF